jgi:hypothetical protein
MLGLTSTGGENRIRFRLTAGGSTTTLVANSGDLVAGQWVHAAAVYDGSSMKLYLDGELVGEQSKGGALTAGSMVDVALGNQPSGAGQRGFDGRLDDVRIYRAALTQAAVRAIASGLGAPFVLQGVAQGGSIGPNYIADTAQLAVLKDGRQIAVLRPEKRLYPVQGMPTTEAAIDRGFTRDLYVALGDEQAGGGWALRTYVKPFANWIWIGAIIMAAGGTISLTDRRYRVGTPARRARPGAAPLPAE